MHSIEFTPRYIVHSLEFVKTSLERRLQNYFSRGKDYIPIEIDWFNVAELEQFNFYIGSRKVNAEEFLVFMLALLPHIQPYLLEHIIQRYLPQGGDFPEIGGIKSSNSRTMLPTGETALFLLAGEDIQNRFRVMSYFTANHFFATDCILSLEPVKEGESKLSGRLLLNEEWVQICTQGKIERPSFGSDFPAKLIETKLQWSDLVINSKTERQIGDIKIWLDHHITLMDDWKMSNKLKPGYRALFYGPPGTGKTLTAALLGKQFHQDVYRIDLSLVVSKYIGETEKNLEKIFTKAQHKDWILFFDEADALFGKRSNVQNAHDKYANQEVSYLLQRVEDFDGLIILASNFKTNIDQAFLRRFNTVIHFPLPNSQERFELWNQSKPSPAVFAHDVDLWSVAQRYELSGSSIVNIIHYASLAAINNKTNQLSKDSILEGIKREYEKEERVFTS